MFEAHERLLGRFRDFSYNGGNFAPSPGVRTGALSSRRLLANPFHVLGVPPTATRQAIEEAGQCLLAGLQSPSDGATYRDYETPLGSQERDAHTVRRALAQLRDPDERIHHEIWAQLRPRRAANRPANLGASALSGWSAGCRAMGWWPR